MATSDEEFNAATGPCVLVAEDEELVRELAIEVLASSGYRTLGARHGGEAIALFDAHGKDIDAVLLDVSMPVMDGLQVLSHIRKSRPDVRVVLTSGFDDTEAGSQTEGDDHVGFLQKPYRSANLIAQIRAMLAT